MKNILVTGISKGLGLETIRLFLDLDYNIIGIYRNRSSSLDLLKKSYNSKLSLIEYDLINTKDIKSMLFENKLNSEPIHGFINNAAIAYDDIVTNINLEKLNEMFTINVYSPMIITKYIIRNMLLNKIKGSIVHLSSISVHTGYKGLSMYASSKGALEAFSKNTAREWGERGIRSNVVVAGFMETDMSKTLDLNTKERIYKRTSLKVPTDLKSVSSAIEFLINDCSKSITGQNIFVDSGTI